MDEKETKITAETTAEHQAQAAVPGTNDAQDGDSTQGATEKATTELDRADQIAERQKRENDRREELLTREEALAARRAVGGVAEAGAGPVEKKPETDDEYFDRFKQGEVNPFKENAQ